MNIFSGKRYFNDILWEPTYNNNTLPDTGISNNKIYKYKEHSYGKVKGKGAIFLKIFVTKKLGIEGEFSNAQMIIYLRRH
jgi:hypothetical protein